MLAQQVAKKYSTALFNLVQDRGLLDLAYHQFEQLDDLLLKERSLLAFLKAPHIPDQHKFTLVRQVFEGKIEPLFLEFLLVLVDKYRIGFLHDIILEFRTRVARAKDMVVAQVTTALPLGDEQRRDLITRLQKKTGHVIDLEEKVDPAILGGMIVIVGDQIIDGSVRHKLFLLKEELLKLKVA
jgi:F-type H+-transporting ATPase subunit delta